MLKPNTHMGKLIPFPIAKKSNNKETPEVCKTEETINECLSKTQLIREDVQKVLNDKSTLLKLSPEDLEKYIKYYILECLIKSKNISSELFLSGEYLSILIKELILGEININGFIIDHIQNDNFKLAADVSILKYIFLYSRKRNEFCSQKDFMIFAINNYYTAYWKTNFKLGFTLSHKLKEIDDHINLPLIPEKMFPKNFHIV